MEWICPFPSHNSLREPTPLVSWQITRISMAISANLGRDTDHNSTKLVCSHPLVWVPYLCVCTQLHFYRSTQTKKINSSTNDIVRVCCVCVCTCMCVCMRVRMCMRMFMSMCIRVRVCVRTCARFSFPIFQKRSLINQCVSPLSPLLPPSNIPSWISMCLLLLLQYRPTPLPH